MLRDMPYRRFEGQVCSVARTLEVIGERWTPLILRELGLGHRRFREIQRGTGVASNILADRLRTLVEQGIVEQWDDETYHATEKGRDLAPVLWAMLAWGDRWAAPEAGPPRLIVHDTCGHATHAVPSCAVCGEPLSQDQVHLAPGPGLP
jgi:DNA-binding HxlR family transcriptional regulator